MAALHRLLIEAGVDISHARLIRVVDNRAQHPNVALPNGFLKSSAAVSKNCSAKRPPR